MYDEKNVCRTCKHCVMTVITNNEVFTPYQQNHYCYLERPEYDYYDGDCICYKEKVTKYE